jgi:hypothetical protein
MNPLSKRLACLALLLVVTGVGAGCAGGPLAAPRENWGKNRLYDLADIFIIEGGVTAANPITGSVPPAFGLYLEATPLCHLGAITFHGYAAGIDGRAIGTYMENRSRFGVGPIQAWQIMQKPYRVNIFKTPGYVWQERMENDMAWDGVPAKNFFYNDQEWQLGAVSGLRGWQQWATGAVEIAVCEPFILNAGGTVRLGIDFSEIFDFVLGFASIDYKRDDLRPGDLDRSQAMLEALKKADEAKKKDKEE